MARRLLADGRMRAPRRGRPSAPPGWRRSASSCAPSCRRRWRASWGSGGSRWPPTRSPPTPAPSALRPGAVVAAGTGLIAIGTDLASWRRADGWGHLLGDCGGGAWIGRAGLEAALRAHDGRPAVRPRCWRAPRRCSARATELPGRLYPRADRPAVLASFAPEVAACARRTTRWRRSILRAAARHIADAAAAVCPPAIGRAPSRPHRRPVQDWATRCSYRWGRSWPERLPHARRVSAAGDPLAGAVRIAAALAADGLALPCDERCCTCWPNIVPEQRASDAAARTRTDPYS